MKAILDFLGFTKAIEIDQPSYMHMEPMTIMGKEERVPFIKISDLEEDGERIALYKLFEPDKDIS